MAEVTEVVAEAAETVADGATNIAEVSRRLSGRETRLVLAGVGLGLAVGGVIGGLIQEKRLRKAYDQLAEHEIDQMREHFRARTVAREEKPSLDELKGVVENAKYSTPKLDPIERKFEELPPETRNVFEDQVAVPSEEGWDYPTELAKRIVNRDTKQPYVIHVDEQHELDYSETTVTYYEGDDVVCDEENRIINKPEAMLGVNFREQFGHGSEDPNMVYIRNDAIAADIEVNCTPGMYSVEVQGLNPETDEDPRSRKVDFDDDD